MEVEVKVKVKVKVTMKKLNSQLPFAMLGVLVATKRKNKHHIDGVTKARLVVKT